MAYLVIGCDLKNQASAGPVWTALESWGAVRLLESMWILNTRLDAGYVRSALQDLVEPQDSVVVIELRHGADWSAVGASEPATAWLRHNLGSDSS
jgi:hypothetical protein